MKRLQLPSWSIDPYQGNRWTKNELQDHGFIYSYWYFHQWNSWNTNVKICNRTNKYQTNTTVQNLMWFLKTIIEGESTVFQYYGIQYWYKGTWSHDVLQWNPEVMMYDNPELLNHEWTVSCSPAVTSNETIISGKVC